MSATQIGAERVRILQQLHELARAAASATSPPPLDVSPHKFFAPAPYAGAIERGSIHRRIASQPGSRIVVLQGPAGHGKSTTLQQIKTQHEAAGWQTAWLTLDEADNDPRRLAYHLHALANLLAADGVVEAAAPRRGRRADWLLDRLVRLQRPAAIFLDEFQALRNRTILALFRDLFERVPDRVKIFIGSRSLPEVGLAKLLVSNVALVINADDLRFSPQEVDEFFSESTGLDISGAEVGTIYRRTEGWPAALQLYRLTLVSPEVRSSLGELALHSPRQLAEYLADNVLALQAPRTQAFLLRTSLLTRLTAPLCDVVTGRTDSQQMLLELERSGLFLRSLDAEGRWFKYHGLFSSILAENFCRRAELQAREVHQRAANWHLEQQQYEEALHHAVQSRDFGLAADTFEAWSSFLICTAHLMTVERWFDRIPFEHIVARPTLAITVAWALMFLRRQQKLGGLLESLRRLAADPTAPNRELPACVLAMAQVFEDDIDRAYASVAGIELDKPTADGFPSFQLGAAENIVAFRNIAVGDFEAAHKTLGAAHAYNQRGGATFSGGYTTAIGGLVSMLQGRLPEALDRLRREAPTSSDPFDKSFAAAAFVSCQMWGLYEANELDAVEALGGQYTEAISDSAILDFIAVALVSLARVHDVRGRQDQAATVLEDLERIGHDSGWSRLVRVADWERARRALAGGDVERARAIVAHMPQARPVPADWIHLADDLGGEALGHVRLAIHEGDSATAGALLAVELARQPGRTYRRMKLHLLEALLRQREGANNAAHRSLRKALQLGNAGRYVRTFLDEGEGIVRLLREEYQRIHELAGRDEAEAADYRAFIEQLLAASGTDLSVALRSEPKVLLEPLSDREQQMVVYLANGVSNRDIAARLFVTENTVKFHLKNVYAKLGVNSRLQAIATARRLGLVK
ncbi:MAG TPA: LuxR C-terminal-related transcriptional regulator [Steroidobacteraceae bacterium]|nr:LuxR C-terminal-related transcriptional regulator [Steroidobacteraceae bacterium]